VIGQPNVLKEVSPSLATAAGGVDKLLSLTNATHHPPFSMTLSFSADFEQQLLTSLDHLWPQALAPAAKDDAKGLLKTSLELLQKSPLPHLINGINSTTVQDARSILDFLWQEADSYRHATMFHVGASTMGVPGEVLNTGLIAGTTGFGAMYTAARSLGSTARSENAELKMQIQAMKAAQALRSSQNNAILKRVGRTFAATTINKQRALRRAAGSGAAAAGSGAAATAAGATRPSLLRRIAQGATQGSVKAFKSIVPTTPSAVGSLAAAAGLEYAARSVLPEQKGASHVMQSTALRFASTLLTSRNLKGAAAMAVGEALYSGAVTYGEALGNFVCDSVINHAMICSAQALEVEKTKAAYAERVARAEKELRQRLGPKRGILDSVCTAVADCQAQTFFFIAEQLATKQRANLVHTGGSIPRPVDPAVTHGMARHAALHGSPDIANTIHDHVSTAENDVKLWEASSPTDLHHILLQLARDERAHRPVAERATMLHALTEAVDMRTESGYQSVVEALGLINVQLWWRDDFSPAYKEAVHYVQEVGMQRAIMKDGAALQAELNRLADTLEKLDNAKYAAWTDRVWQGHGQEARATVSPEVQAQLSKAEADLKLSEASLQAAKQEQAAFSQKILDLEQRVNEALTNPELAAEANQKLHDMRAQLAEKQQKLEDATKKYHESNSNYKLLVNGVLGTLGVAGGGGGVAYWWRNVRSAVAADPREAITAIGQAAAIMENLRTANTFQELEVLMQQSGQGLSNLTEDIQGLIMKVPQAIADVIAAKLDRIAAELKDPKPQVKYKGNVKLIQLLSEDLFFLVCYREQALDKMARTAVAEAAHNDIVRDIAFKDFQSELLKCQGKAQNDEMQLSHEFITKAQGFLSEYSKLQKHQNLISIEALNAATEQVFRVDGGQSLDDQYLETQFNNTLRELRDDMDKLETNEGDIISGVVRNLLSSTDPLASQKLVANASMNAASSSVVQSPISAVREALQNHTSVKDVFFLSSVTLLKQLAKTNQELAEANKELQQTSVDQGKTIVHLQKTAEAKSIEAAASGAAIRENLMQTITSAKKIRLATRLATPI